MRIKGLDNLRVFGISLVVIYHIFKEFLPAGFLGVNIMFVLSGFLVSFHLLNEVYKTDDIDLKTYYKKRYRRIYPGVLFMVFVVSLMAIFVNRDCGYYNVGTGVGTSLLDQIRGMVEVFGEGDKKSQIIMRPDKPNAPQYIMDITPAIQELGYKPKYNYLEMLRDFKREMQYAENVGR